MNQKIQEIYPNFFEALKNGKRRDCTKIINEIIHDVTAEDIYFDLLQSSLYEIGKLWETNKISVAAEHMATAIVEGILNQMFSQIETEDSVGKKLVMACAKDEHHQVGPKIIADYFEYKGWQTFFVGSDTPADELIRSIGEISPDVLGLSVSIAFNVDSLLEALKAIEEEFPDLKVIVGGQGLEYSNLEPFSKFKNVSLLRTLDQVKVFLGAA